MPEEFDVFLSHNRGDDGATAKAVLRLSSFLASGPIPVLVFAEGGEVLEAAVDLLAQETGEEPDAQPLHEALSELAASSRVTIQEATFTVHPGVQEATRAQIPKEQQKDWIAASLRLIARVNAGHSGDVRAWPVWDLLRAHATEVIRWADQAGLEERTPLLRNNLGLYLKGRGLYAEAEPLMRRALDISENIYGGQHPKVAVYLNNLALLLRATNRLSEAEPLLRRALEIDEAASGSQHPKVARDLNNLALLLQDTGRLAEAEPMLRRALEIDEATLGSQHPNVARSLNNLALLLEDTDRRSEAEPLLRRALAIDEAASGSQHPDVARDLNSLASLLQDTNRLAEAEPLMRRAVEIWEGSLGPDHPYTQIGRENLEDLLEEIAESGEESTNPPQSSGGSALA